MNSECTLRCNLIRTIIFVVLITIIVIINITTIIKLWESAHDTKFQYISFNCFINDRAIKIYINIQDVICWNRLNTNLKRSTWIHYQNCIVYLFLIHNSSNYLIHKFVCDVYTRVHALKYTHMHKTTQTQKFP